jgi:hypothetical protein
MGSTGALSFRPGIVAIAVVSFHFGSASSSMGVMTVASSSFLGPAIYSWLGISVAGGLGSQCWCFKCCNVRNNSLIHHRI